LIERKKRISDHSITKLLSFSLSLSCSYGNNENIHIFDLSGRHQTSEQLQLFLCFVRSLSLSFFTSLLLNFNPRFCYDYSRLELTLMLLVMSVLLMFSKRRFTAIFLGSTVAIWIRKNARL